MNSYNRRKWRIIRDYSIGWIFAFVFLSIVRGVGTEELGLLKFDFVSSVIISVTLGPIIGLVTGFTQIVMEEKVYRRISIQHFLILRFFYTILFVFLLIGIAYVVYRLYFGTEIAILIFAFDTGSFAVYFYVLFVDFFLNVLYQVNMMLGEGNLRRFIRGEFYTPSEELRVFMFLDLQSSTTIAERLGHLSYSLLIQDCFNDLSVVVEHDAEIYQYVGDEAVLTWKLKKGIKNQNCLRAFFRFKKQIYKRTEYYQNKYGVIPFFKGGLHSGKVTVTEIGKVKKEIAYHGDPINTASRIQGQCNTFQQELLISEDLKAHLASDDFNFKYMDKIHLRGKQTIMAIYAVEKN